MVEVTLPFIRYDDAISGLNIVFAASGQTHRRQFSKLNPLFGYSAAILPASNASMEIILICLNFFYIYQRDRTKYNKFTQSTNTS